MQLSKLFGLSLILLLSACSTSQGPKRAKSTYTCVYQPLAKGGAFYKDDGPDSRLPSYLDSVAEPTVKREPLHRYANRPYTVLGKRYVPRTRVGDFVQEGIGSWYGRKFHGQKTASGERYDMYAMTAAHPTLPIPSYVRVTNQKNGRSVVVRINDRGPFHKERIIDLSFLAACRLAYTSDGSAPLRVESLLPGKYRRETEIDEDSIVHVQDTTTIAPLLEKPKGEIFIQLAAFSSYGNAESFRIKVAEILNEPLEKIYLHSQQDMTRVRMGPFKDKASALEEVERLTGDHHIQAVIVH